MTDKKLTDEEIIRRLERCVKRGNRNYDTDIVLDLITRQQEDIEMLKETIEYKDICIEACEDTKSEAVKQCLANVKNYIKTHCNPYGKPDFDYDTSIKILNFIDNLVKEMTEVEK